MNSASVGAEFAIIDCVWPALGTKSVSSPHRLPFLRDPQHATCVWPISCLVGCPLASLDTWPARTGRKSSGALEKRSDRYTVATHIARLAACRPSAISKRYSAATCHDHITQPARRSGDASARLRAGTDCLSGRSHIAPISVCPHVAHPLTSTPTGG
jgi:hypothetical protein